MRVLICDDEPNVRLLYRMEFDKVSFASRIPRLVERYGGAA